MWYTMSMITRRQRIKSKRLSRTIIGLWILTLIMLLYYKQLIHQPTFISPVEADYTPSQVVSPTPVPTPKIPVVIPEPIIEKAQTIEPVSIEIDILVDKYAEKYTKSLNDKSIMKAKLQFLLSKEAKHGLSKNHGDGGKAGGPLQFHEPTYIGYRKLMMKKGLVDFIGSRYDYDNAIETTAWAIADGRGTAWGPLLRGEIDL